jgi:hypothetical protein
MIGVAISTCNRREIADHAINQWYKFLPAGAKLVIVDDNSEIPYPEADFRFEQRAGVSVVKNKCLELLQNCEHIFLSDDDVFPTDKNWFLPYAAGNLWHACYIFDRVLLNETFHYKSYDLPRGCLLYFRKTCIQFAGGFDTNFKMYGYDQAELSRRIYNMGLTPAPYIDSPHSAGLFFSHDEHRTGKSCLTAPERTNFIRANKIYFDKTENNKTYIPFK